jgi:hypothetical protein
MARRSLRPSLGLAVLLCCTVPGVRAEDDHPFPYRVMVHAEWGEPRGSASFLDVLRRELVIDLTRSGCFREVSAEPPATAGPEDLQLLVRLQDYSERTDFEYRLADRADPQLDLARRTVVHLDTTCEVAVFTLAEGVLVRGKRERRRSSWRPLVNEDPREEARRQLIESVVRTARRFACKGSTESWAKRIERARSAR